MTKNEWDQCFIWLLALFPTWKPNSMTSPAWFDELHSVPPQAFKAAVKGAMIGKDNPSYPPGVFEIKAMFKPQFEQVDELWHKILQGCSDTDMSPPAQRALKSIGGAKKVRNTNLDELPWLKKDFMRAFEVFCQRSIEKPYSDLIQLENNVATELIGGLSNAKTMP
jgi:hypothetical protein